MFALSWPHSAPCTIIPALARQYLDGSHWRLETVAHPSSVSSEITDKHVYVIYIYTIHVCKQTLSLWDIVGYFSVRMLGPGTGWKGSFNQQPKGKTLKAAGTQTTPCRLWLRYVEIVSEGKNLNKKGLLSWVCSALVAGVQHSFERAIGASPRGEPGCMSKPPATQQPHWYMTPGQSSIIDASQVLSSAWLLPPLSTEVGPKAGERLGHLDMEFVSAHTHHKHAPALHTSLAHLAPRDSYAAHSYGLVCWECVSEGTLLIVSGDSERFGDCSIADFAVDDGPWSQQMAPVVQDFVQL